MPDSIEVKLQKIRVETTAREAEGKKAAELSAKRDRFEAISLRRDPLVQERDGLKKILNSLQAGYSNAERSLAGYAESKERIKGIVERYQSELSQLGISDIGSLLASHEFGGGTEAVAFKESKERLKSGLKGLKKAKEK